MIEERKMRHIQTISRQLVLVQSQGRDRHRLTHTQSIYAELCTFPGKVSDCSKLLFPALQRTYVIQTTTKPGKENYIELTGSLHRQFIVY